MPFLGSKYAKIAFAALLGELTVLPPTSSWIKGPTSKGMGGKRKVVSPFLEFLDLPLTLHTQHHHV